jgi:hypothetical protein
METVLNVFAPIATVIFLIGITLNLGRWFKAAAFKRRFRGVTKEFEGGPEHVGIIQGMKEVLIDPIKHFYAKANKSWNRGYMFYHIAIVTEVIGYSIAAVIVFFHILVGNRIPDVAASHGGEVALGLNYSPANILAIIFGNGEHIQADFLFGNFGTLFINITWVAVGFAVLGNLHMVYTIIRKRSASSILGDIDPAAKGVRAKGTLKWDRVVVRILIFTIIWTELLARLEAVEGIVFFHAFLATVMLTLFPFTYLFHMVYNLIALAYSTKRRMVRTVA